MYSRRGVKLRIVDALRALFDGAPRYVATDFAECASSAHVDPEVFIQDPSCVSLAENAALYRGVRVMCGPGTFALGANSHLACGAYVNAVKGEVRIGRGVAIGPNAVIVSYSNASVPGVAVVDAHVCEDVNIGDNVFIGAGAVILPGVDVGAGAVIGAGAVVRHSVPPSALAVGVPARVVRMTMPSRNADGQS